jgi:hypothetical protein
MEFHILFYWFNQRQFLWGISSLWYVFCDPVSRWYVDIFLQNKATKCDYHYYTAKMTQLKCKVRNTTYYTIRISKSTQNNYTTAHHRITTLLDREECRRSLPVRYHLFYDLPRIWTKSTNCLTKYTEDTLRPKISTP